MIMLVNVERDIAGRILSIQDAVLNEKSALFYFIPKTLTYLVAELWARLNSNDNIGFHQIIGDIVAIV